MSTLRVRRLDSNRDMTFGRGAQNYASGLEAVMQRVKARLLVLRGEWFLDTSDGVPWFQPGPNDAQAIMGGPRNLMFAESQLKAAILQTDGVSSITSFTMNFTSANRKLTVSVRGTTVDGDAFALANVGVT
jgi:hypothetical protein